MTFQPIGIPAARVVERLSARQDRDMARARRAATRARADGAMSAAVAMIGTAFDEAAAINAFKLRVERIIKLGTGHRAVRARYGARAEMLRGRPLDIAILTVERWYRAERKAFQVASAFGCASRLSVEVLCELRLILRLISASKQYRDHFPGILAFVLGADANETIAAE